MDETLDGFFATQMRRLDRLLHREILRLRAAYQLSLDEFRGLYVSDEQVDALVNAQRIDTDTDQASQISDDASALANQAATLGPRCATWQHLIEEFSLSPIEQDIVLIALAPELDLKYETLYAYLNNDVTRKWPTRELTLRLLSTGSNRLLVRRQLSAESTLFRTGLVLSVQPGDDRHSWLAGGFRIAPMVSSYLLGLGMQLRDSPLGSLAERSEPSICWDEVPVAEHQLTAVRRIVELYAPSVSCSPIALVFEGRYGSGAFDTANAVCADFGIALLRIDLERARAAGEPLEKALKSLTLERRLYRAGVYLDGCEALFDREGKPLPDAYGLLDQLMPGPMRIGRQLSDPIAGVTSDVRRWKVEGPLFLACEPKTNWRGLLQGRRVAHFRFDDPDFATRLNLWKRYLGEWSTMLSDAALRALSDRFVLSPGQIRDAVTSALDARHMSAQQSIDALDTQTLFAAARNQSDQNLGRLAIKVHTVHGWDDLILPASIQSRVKEITDAIKHRHIVYASWGFEQRVTQGKGLKVLFAGASGTGKTMTAGVIARELGLDLYKIDLCSVVSKYIGETEKNLDRIFDAARCSNAILFFDEADALFGKRSEVKDAHDRYANIEVAYLLQRMEEYEGVVILASNLSKNIDEAFSRRMHYVVEFPLPDEDHREQLWRAMFPPQVPMGNDVDYSFLARQFPIAGGDIRNVALHAAFLAARDGQIVTMKQLINAMGRQLTKQGRIPSPSDFKQYHDLIGQGD